MRLTGPTVEPIDGSLGRGGVVEGDGGLPLQLPRLPVGVQVDHGQARLLVDLKGAEETPEPATHDTRREETMVVGGMWVGLGDRWLTLMIPICLKKSATDSTV